jgi:hypothetical protein
MEHGPPGNAVETEPRRDGQEDHPNRLSSAMGSSFGMARTATFSAT